MEPQFFIVDLQSKNARSLKTFPPEVIRNQVIRHNSYIIVNDDQGRPVGYLLHSLLRLGAGVRIDAICVAKHARRRGHGRRLIDLLLKRARHYQASKVVCRCPAHIKAAGFFEHIGFTVTTQKRDVQDPNHLITLYSAEPDLNRTPHNGPRIAPSRWNGYLSRSTRGL